MPFYRILCEFCLCHRPLLATITSSKKRTFLLEIKVSSKNFYVPFDRLIGNTFVVSGFSYSAFVNKMINSNEIIDD